MCEAKGGRGIGGWSLEIPCFSAPGRQGIVVVPITLEIDEERRNGRVCKNERSSDARNSSTFTARVCVSNCTKRGTRGAREGGRADTENGTE